MAIQRVIRYLGNGVVEQRAAAFFLERTPVEPALHAGLAPGRQRVEPAAGTGSQPATPGPSDRWRACLIDRPEGRRSPALNPLIVRYPPAGALFGL